MKTSEKKEFAQLTNEECKFIENYRKLSEEEKMKIIKLIEDTRQVDHTD